MLVLEGSCSFLASRLVLDTAPISAAMAFIPYFSLVSVFIVYTIATNGHTPRGVSLMCHERYFMISVDQLFTGKNLRFEAVDENATHPITEEYAAKCGYSIRVLHLKNNVQLRASYFSCHTDKVDEVFSFSFNLIAHKKGKVVTHALHKMCSPSLPWSLREVTCEVNYMEVSVRSEITCPQSTKRNDWDNLKLAHSPSSADWQVLFRKDEEHLLSTSIKDVRSQGYVFDLIGDRLVFRTPYGQPHSFTSMIDGVPMEVVHATLFSQQSWLVLLVDLVAACSVCEATYEDEGYMSWETPDVLFPGLHTTNYSFGLNGELLQPTIAKDKGYLMEKYNSTVEISVPYDAEGGHRKSVVSGDLFEFFVYDFYMEQISVDGDKIETRIRTQRTMRTPLLKQTLVEENRTILEEQHFTTYLGNIPQDVQLISVELNGHQFQAPFQNDSTFTVAEVVHPNNTKGYTLTVPFYSSLVTQQFSKGDILFKLDLSYALMVTPENQLYNHSASYVAVLPDNSPPQFEASCSESGIDFKLEHKRSDYKWDITVGFEPLTSVLAKKQGLIMKNNSQTLNLHVPRLSYGCKKKNFTLQGFMGTFEILVRDRETYEVQSSTVKTCPFFMNEFIECSTEMKMTAVVNLSLAAASGGVPSKMTLLHQKCGPIEADATRALFSFRLNDCSSNTKVELGTVTYENIILYKNAANGEVYRVLLQCTYPILSLHRLFAMIFESDSPGVGRIIHTSPSASTGLQRTIKPPTLLPQQGLYSSARYIKLVELSVPQQLRGKRLDGINGRAVIKTFH